MNQDHAKSHGLAAYSMVSWLNGNRPTDISLSGPPVHYGIGTPRTKEDTEIAIKRLLAAPVGEMLASGGEERGHIVPSRPEVARALELAGRLGPGDRVDHLERCYHDLRSTVCSPKIWSGISSLAACLLRRRSMGGDRVSAVLRSSMADGKHKGAVFPLTRKITIV